MKRALSFGIGVALLGAACSGDGSRLATDPGPSFSRGAPMAGLFAPAAIASTHPAGVLQASSPLGGRPHGVDISSNNVVYITRLDSAKVQRVDLPSFAFTGSIAVGATPTGVNFHPAGQAAWVTNQAPVSTSSVSVIDVPTNTQVRTITRRTRLHSIRTPSGYTRTSLPAGR